MSTTSMNGPRKLVRLQDVPSVLQLERPLSSRGRNSWTTTVDVQSYDQTGLLHMPGMDHHVLVLNLRPQTIYARADGKEQRVKNMPVGHIGMVPAGLETYYDASAGSSMSIYVPPDLLDGAYEKITGRARANVSLPHLLSGEDPTLSCLCDVMRLELQKSEYPAQALLVETVLSAITIHLAGEYAGARTARDSVYSLRPGALKAVLDFIGDRPGEAVSLTELAKLAGVSKFYFSRMFKVSMGISPIQYVEKRRIEWAAALIKEGKHTLIQISMMSGFADQAHFSRRFRLRIGCTPTQYASTHAPHILRTRSVFRR